MFFVVLFLNLSMFGFCGWWLVINFGTLFCLMTFGRRSMTVELIDLVTVGFVGPQWVING